MPELSKPGEVANAILEILSDGDLHTLSDVAATSGRSHGNISDAVGKLVARGLVEIPRRGAYQLTEAGFDALASGVTITSGPDVLAGPRKAPRDTFRQRCWAAMHVRQIFTLGDLMADADRGASASRSNLAKYMRALIAAEYVAEMAERQPGTKNGSNGFKRYRLLKRTGPIAPVFSEEHSQLQDPNVGKAVPCKA
ncbi:winged helix-turn-helix domain-containing protein [Oceaniglobus trochenteri]|uniref:winged helix-turn-helix domain-containing protein n=1 Tax=Oceaniglobus trochenteri TaxID=2763260 RepID=UPI001CFFB2D4|nr:winged helix-turn-helix domain-containing protein [Oceaniglobus trochenteri]